MERFSIITATLQPRKARSDSLFQEDFRTSMHAQVIDTDVFENSELPMESHGNDRLRYTGRFRPPVRSQRVHQQTTTDRKN
jgi:hypothetical protein